MVCVKSPYQVIDSVHLLINHAVETTSSWTINNNEDENNRVSAFHNFKWNEVFLAGRRSCLLLNETKIFPLFLFQADIKRKILLTNQENNVFSLCNWCDSLYLFWNNFCYRVNLYIHFSVTIQMSNTHINKVVSSILIKVH